MIEDIRQANPDRRSFLKNIAAFSASVALAEFSPDLIEKAAAQERVPQKPYELQEPKIPTPEGIDKIMHEYIAERKNGNSDAFDAIEVKIFGSSDAALEGIRVFEQTSGITDSVAKLRSRAQMNNLSTAQIDEIYAKAQTIKRIADTAHVDFMGALPDYISAIISGLDTKWNGEDMHKHALNLARANDSLVKLRDGLLRIASSQ